MSADRNAVRSALLGSKKNAPPRLITVDGVDVELRSPPFSRRTRVLEKLGIVGLRINKLPLSTVYKLKLEATILCAYAPDDAKPLFTDADREELENSDAGGFVDVIGDAAIGILLNGSKSVADAKKGSSTTLTEGSSTPSPSASANPPDSSPTSTPSTT